MQEAIETYKKSGHTIDIFPDDNPPHPRKDQDNLGTMVMWHGRYDLGDDHEFSEPSDFRDWLMEEREEGRIYYVLDVYMYDHGNITFSLSPFSCPWDSGQAGYIYIGHHVVLDNWNLKEWNDEAISKARECLKAEVQEYATYHEGGFVGFVVRTPEGEVLDSCWGFSDLEYCKETAESCITQLELSL